MNIGQRQYKQASCRIEIPECVPEDMRQGMREVVSVASENGRNGEATALMFGVCAEADVDGVVLILMPQPFSHSLTPEPAMSAEQLEKFYSKFGFVVVQQEPAVLMARQPVIRSVQVAH
jgi:hypothetical protein